jgi:peptidase E
MKPVYLLAGGRGGDRKKMTTLIRSILLESGKKSPKIAYLGAATDDNLIFYKMMTSPLLAEGAGQVNRVVLASKKADIQKAKALLEVADVIYFGGGDVERGMQVLEEKNMVGFMQELARRDKLILGVSAGSIMLAKEWVRWRDPDDDNSVEIFPCLNIAPVVCDTHAEEDDWQELKTLLKIAPADMTGYGIPSGAAIKVFPNGTVEALGGTVCRFSRHGKTVSRDPAILPAVT